MSLNVQALKVQPLIDPRINVNNERVYTVLKGGSNITYRQFISTSYSNSQLTFSCTPPNDKSLICSNIYLQMQFTLNFTGTTLSGNLLKSLYDCPASFPICKAINNMTITLNNAPISYNYSDIFPWLFRYEQGLELGRYDLTSTPDQLDEHNDLSAYSSLGSARSPFALYGENSARMSRNSFSYEIVSNTPTSAEVRFTCVEPLFLPGLLNFNDEKLTSALTNIQTNDYVFTLNTNLSNIWSHSPGSDSTFTNITVTPNATQAPQLLFCYITTDYLSIIPPTLVYSYAQMDRYQQNVGALTAGQETTIYMSSIQLKVIPKCMYIFARESNNSLSEISTDCFASISNLSVDFCNRTAILSSASQFDLWKISRKNGLNMSFEQFKTYTGSILSIYFDEDIGTGGNSLDVSGTNGQYQLAIKCNLKNIFNRTVNYTLYMIVINDGVINLSNGMAILSNSVVSKEDVYKAFSETDAYDDYGFYREMSGRGIIQNAGAVIKKVNRWVNKKAIPAISGVARTIERGREALEDVTGSTYGSGLVGGEVLTRHQLQKNMRKLM